MVHLWVRFAHSTSVNDPPQMIYFTTAYLAGNIGLALVDLALDTIRSRRPRPPGAYL